MSGESQQTRQLNFVGPPRAGLISTFAVTTTAGVIDLSKLDNQTKNLGQPKTMTVGANGTYVSFFADGGDVYINVGETNASVSGANAPLPTATAGINIAQGCWKIPSGTTFRIICVSGDHPDQFVGYVTATSTATLRVYRSSIQA